MENSNANTQPKKKLKRFLLLGTLSFIVVLFLAHFIWVFSGSNEWELVTDENGVQVYTLKSPGSVLKKLKGIVRVQLPLSHIVAAMLDNSVENCAKWLPGCVVAKPIENWNSQSLSSIDLYQLNLPSPFDPREFLLKTKLSQDPKTKTVLIEFIAVPDEIPQNECCVRIKEMHNFWQYTPLENGEVEVEFTTNMDLGGFVPYFLANSIAPRNVYTILSNLSIFLDEEKYQNAKFDFIEEKSDDALSELITTKP